VIDDGPCVVWMANKLWHDHSVDRSMTRELQRHARILWVDSPLSLATSARGRFGVARTSRPMLSVINDRITRLTPAALPGMTRIGVRGTTAPLVHAQVRWALRRTAMRPHAVVATYFEGVLGWQGQSLLRALHATDDYVAGADLMRVSAGWLQAQEKRALTCADVVTAHSRLLADRWSARYGRPVTFIPNGCSPTPERAPALPTAIRELPRPIVGLAGRLNARIDMDLVEGIADAGFSLLLLGQHDARWEPLRFAALIRRPRVHYAGWVRPEDVADYLGATDVGITPYLDSPFNLASFPVKTLDYLSAGRPAVSTDLPAARWLADDLARSDQAAAASQILALADGRSAFIDEVRRLAGHSGRGYRAACEARRRDQECRAFAARHSWSRRANVLAAVLGLT
jgi:teichuronic acid biosynthesis glycosyltransferase TuaH